MRAWEASDVRAVIVIASRLWGVSWGRRPRKPGVPGARGRRLGYLPARTAVAATAAARTRAARAVVAAAVLARGDAVDLGARCGQRLRHPGEDADMLSGAVRSCTPYMPRG